MNRIKKDHSLDFFCLEDAVVSKMYFSGQRNVGCVMLIVETESTGTGLSVCDYKCALKSGKVDFLKKLFTVFAHSRVTAIMLDCW